jgi:hypothetical protein
MVNFSIINPIVLPSLFNRYNESLLLIRVIGEANQNLHSLFLLLCKSFFQFP